MSQRTPSRPALLALLLLGLLLAAGIATAQDDESIRVGVVVKGPDGEARTYCVTLDGPEPTGADALAATGLDLVFEDTSQGSAICRLDGVGCTPPGDLCFCQCTGGPSCAYWAYFHLSDAGTWSYGVTSSTSYTLEHGDVEGWWWRDSGAEDRTPPPALAFDAICADDADPAFPRTVIDGLGRAVTLDAPPQRIASVTLGSDEILLDLVGPDRLLGVSYFAADPGISNVSDRLDGIEHTDLSGEPERLIGLDADLVVLASYSNAAVLDQLEDAAVPIFVLADFNTIEDLRANIRLLGEVTGEEAHAEDLIAEMDARLEAVAEAVAGQEPVRALYYEPGGITYGPGSTVDEIMTLAGGINVATEAGLGPYPLVDPEFVLAADPDAVLLGGWFGDAGDSTAWFTSDPAFSTLRAVQEGRVYPISAAHMTNVSHHIATGVEDVAHALYPQAFPDTAPEATEENTDDHID